MKKFRNLAIVLAAVCLTLGAVVMAGVLKAKAADVPGSYSGDESAMLIATGPEAGEEVAAADSVTGTKAIAAAIAIGVAAVAGALGMSHAIAKSNEGVARQPEAAGKIQTQLMLGLVFIETVIIYALIVAILIVFVL